MNPEEYKRMHDLEDRYWWFVGRRNLALGLLKKFLPYWKASNKPLVMDLGCGTGVVSHELLKDFRTISLDMSELALEFCQARQIPNLVKARGEFLPIKTGTIDAIVALDIIEHIEDDKAAFTEAFRVLKPGGILVMSVPAFMSLWGPHDIALMHFRRYTVPEVRGRLLDAGFEIERLSYSVFFLFPVVMVVRFFEKRRKGEAKASLVPVPAWANRFLIGLQWTERNLILRGKLPFGSSVVAVAKKAE